MAPVAASMRFRTAYWTRLRLDPMANRLPMSQHSIYRSMYLPCTGTLLYEAAAYRAFLKSVKTRALYGWHRRCSRRSLLRDTEDSKMKAMLPLVAIVAGTLSTCAHSQVNPDYRIRAKLRTPADATWGANESVGNADFRVHSRFGHVYYGGVIRSDEFKFKVQIDYRDISGFDTNFLTSTFNSDYDVYINDGYVGRAIMGTEDVGLAELAYDSRHPDFPELPLPAGFPDPVELFDVVSVYFAAPSVPAIGDPLPVGTPVFQSELIEDFTRGDANLDGKVDADDYAILANVYDPFHVLGEHIGPMAGDFTADNLADRSDYDTLVANWTDSHDIPGEPEPIATPCYADTNGDGVLSPADFSAWVSAFNTMAPSCDQNSDGICTPSDFSAWVANYNAGC